MCVITYVCTYVAHMFNTCTVICSSMHYPFVIGTNIRRTIRQTSRQQFAYDSNRVLLSLGKVRSMFVVACDILRSELLNAILYESLPEQWHCSKIDFLLLVALCVVLQQQRHCNKEDFCCCLWHFGLFRNRRYIVVRPIFVVACDILLLPAQIEHK